MSESELVEWSVLGSENLQSQVRIHSSSKNNFAQIDNNLTRPQNCEFGQNRNIESMWPKSKRRNARIQTMKIARKIREIIIFFWQCCMRFDDEPISPT